MNSKPESNQLLALLPQESKDRIFPQLQEVTLAQGENVYVDGSDMDYVYFPVDCLISLVYVRRSGRSAEISVLGREGIVGIAISIGEDRTPSRAAVQIPGMAYRLSTPVFRRQVGSDPSFRWLMLSYSRSLIAQMAQTASCNRHHTLDQQLCRWLLLSMDRLPSQQLTLTDKLLAEMLGVAQDDIVDVAKRLHDAGIIRYEAGTIMVLDRGGLEKFCCECYSFIMEESDRLAISADPL
ncbi:Crp/Fnr family transcriptional regulator [Wenzhouxiangella limi]|uniref:Crp/Fnr family transcriptional regulator n=1 Tax=Wenzhouxiangella limi TaxID=2707351 RepID=A0A845UY77_9GAMM|nr:Crp/Fnr family transcriptional regulator [Wenzhouxiangella limi]NDY96793.1 Crp/Fnr family transcriptional regulator [Wenzhouxiangella limi]